MPDQHQPVSGSRTSIRFAGAVACALAVALVSAGQASAAAPALGRVGLRQAAVAPTVWDQSDPSVLVAGGKTYLFGSSNNMRLPVRELTTFRGTLAASQAAWGSTPRNAMSRLPAWVNPSDSQIWAPSVAKVGTRYIAYFAAHRRGATDRGNDQCIGRAIAAAPMGPYAPESAPIYCGLPPERGSNRWGRGALDPEVVRAPNGALYLLVALSRTRDNIGALRLSADGKVVGGPNAKASTLASQRFGWHDGVDDSRLNATFLENPSMVYEPATRTYLLFYSAGDWRTSRYVTGFGRCSTPVGPCTLDSRGPFLKAGANRSGVGGLTAFRDPAGVLRVVYASWRSGREGVGGGTYSRHTSLARLVVSGSSAATQRVTLGPS
jgi:hypothetical protein